MFVEFPANRPCPAPSCLVAAPRTYYEPTWTSPPENVQRHSCVARKWCRRKLASPLRGLARRACHCLAVCGSLCTSCWKEILIVYNGLSRAPWRTQRCIHRHLLSHVPTSKQPRYVRHVSGGSSTVLALGCAFPAPPAPHACVMTN